MAAIRAPLSARSVGRSAEDDDGAQDVLTAITFNKDGASSGWRDDTEDGTYGSRAGGRPSTVGPLGGARDGRSEGDAQGIAGGGGCLESGGILWRVFFGGSRACG